MLGSIKNLLVIVHLCLFFFLILPGNATMFFEALFDMIAFDPVDVTEQIDWFFELS